MFAAAEMTLALPLPPPPPPPLLGGVGVDAVGVVTTGEPSALRFLDSLLLEMGLISWARRVSVLL